MLGHDGRGFKTILGAEIQAISLRSAQALRLIRSAHFSDTDRSLQPEIQHGFSRDSYTFATRQRLRGCSCRGAGQSAYGRALAAASDGTDNRAEQTSASSKFGRALIGSEPLAPPLDEVAGFEPILASMNAYSHDINRQFGSSLHFSLRPGLTNDKCCACAARNRDLATAVEHVARNHTGISLAGLGRFRIDGLISADRERRTRRNSVESFAWTIFAGRRRCGRWRCGGRRRGGRVSRRRRRR